MKGRDRFTSRATWIHCRDWPIVGAGYGDGDLIAVTEAKRVVALSRAARQVGITKNMTQRQAQRIHPGLICVTNDINSNIYTFSSVLNLLDDVAVRIEMGVAGSCSFPTKGPSRYFGGDKEMGDHIVGLVDSYLEGTTTVTVGTADSRFAAYAACLQAEPGCSLVVPRGESESFLTGIPVELLVPGLGEIGADLSSGDVREAVEIVGTLKKLGLVTLGDVAELTQPQMLGRFGTLGSILHDWAKGLDHRVPNPLEIEEDLSKSIVLDPLITQSERAVFITKVLADEFCAALKSRGASCTRIVIALTSESGQYQERIWRSAKVFTPTAIAERMRWQVDGWLNAVGKAALTGALKKIEIRPDDLGAVQTQQLSFWDPDFSDLERASRAIARVQAQCGPGVVSFLETSGGRSVGDSVTAVAAETQDLITHHKKESKPDIDKFNRSWPGAIPKPEPVRKIVAEEPVTLLDVDGQPVVVNTRSVLSAPPVHLIFERHRYEVLSYSAPWPLLENWWDEHRQKRCVRMQVLLCDQRAFLVVQKTGRWFIEAAYD